MSNKVYVGNLPYSFLNDDLQRLFAAFGQVRMAEVILDRTTNRSRGFGFVEMENADGVRAAISNLHETELQGRRLTVTEAREREFGGSAPRSFSGPRTGGGHGYDPQRSSARPEHGAQRSSSRPEHGAPRSSARPDHGGARPSGGVGGGPSSGFGGGRGGGSPRGDRRPRRDEGDRWSDGGGGGRRRRRDDDFGDE